MSVYFQQIISNPLTIKIFVTLVGVVLIASMITFIKKGLYQYVKDKNNWYKTKKVINIFGYILLAIFIILTYSNNSSDITIIIGIASAGLAFALQEVIISIAGWMAILVSNIYKTGDRVLLGGIRGDVIDQGILRTTIMEIGNWVDADLYNGRIVRISNSYVFKEPVYNYSTDFPFLWDEIKIPIRYGSNFNKAKTIISAVGEEVVGDYCKEAQIYWADMVRKYLIEDASTKPMVTMIANDNWIEYTLRYVVDYKKRRSIQDILFTRILEEIDKNKNEVQIASATIELVKAPPVDVNIRSKEVD